MSKRKQAKEASAVEEESKFKFPLTWTTAEGLIHGDCAGAKPSEKVLSFDMDDTLIKVKSGGKFAKNADDWTILNDKVVPTIKEYYDKGFKIVIMTNQGGIEKGHTTAQEVQRKIQKLVEFIGVPIQALISPYKNYYRKPSIGMWRHFCDKMNGGVKPDPKESIYCGDAAGRPKEGTRKADHDITDYKFALNCGINFKTPEMLFLGIKETLPKIEWDPKALPKSGQILVGKDKDKIKSGEKEMIIFVGSAGSGKSTLWRTYLSDYVRVNNDTLKTKAKCLKVADEAMAAGKSLVIDNTNPGKATRKEYIDLAKKHNYPVRCFHFDIPKDLAFHLDDLRSYNIHRKHESGHVGKTTIHTFYKNMDPPTLSEGFKEIEKVNFVAGPFHNKDDEEMFYCYVSSKK